MKIDLITATHDDFEKFVGQKFRVQTTSGPIELTLDNIKIFEKSVTRDNYLELQGVVYPPRQAFALTWVGPLEPILEPQTFKVTHDKTGEMELFISAFRRDSDLMLYETVFN